MPPTPLRLLTTPLLLVALAAAPASTLQPGLWRFDNVPQTATLDGRRLADLPYTPSGPQTMCGTPADAATPAKWFARDSGNDCTFTRQSVANGKVDITGTCPPSQPGFDRGTVALTARWTSSGHALRFATLTHGDQGRMAFGGTMTGKRIGDCPPR